MMQSLGCLGMALLQDDTGALQHDVHWMMICMAIIAIGVICGLIGVGIAGIVGLRLVRKFEQMAERIEAEVTPLTAKAHGLVEELTPKVRSITTNVEQISYTVRGKVEEFSATADEINRTVKDVNAKTKAKVSRVDGMVDEALNTAHNVSRTVQDSIRKPVQQIAGIIAGLRTGLETLVERSPFVRRARAASVNEVYEAEPPYSQSAQAPFSQAGTTKRTTPYDL